MFFVALFEHIPVQKVFKIISKEFCFTFKFRLRFLGGNISFNLREIGNSREVWDFKGSIGNRERFLETGLLEISRAFLDEKISRSITNLQFKALGNYP